jgi:hypothetical protein
MHFHFQLTNILYFTFNFLSDSQQRKCYQFPLTNVHTFNNCREICSPLFGSTWFLSVFLVFRMFIFTLYWYCGVWGGPQMPFMTCVWCNRHIQSKTWWMNNNVSKCQERYLWNVSPLIYCYLQAKTPPE